MANWGKTAARYLLLAGVALGGSLSSKSSGFFAALVLATLFPLAALLGGGKGGRARRVARAILQLSLILILGLLVLWAVYGFEFRKSENRCGASGPTHVLRNPRVPRKSLC